MVTLIVRGASVWVGRRIYFECLDFKRSGGHPERCLMDSREYSLKLSREVKAKDRWMAEPSLLPFLQEIKCISQP